MGLRFANRNSKARASREASSKASYSVRSSPLNTHLVHTWLTVRRDDVRVHTQTPDTDVCFLEVVQVRSRGRDYPAAQAHQLRGHTHRKRCAQRRFRRCVCASIEQTCTSKEREHLCIDHTSRSSARCGHVDQVRRQRYCGNNNNKHIAPLSQVVTSNARNIGTLLMQTLLHFCWYRLFFFAMVDRATK